MSRKKNRARAKAGAIQMRKKLPPDVSDAAASMSEIRVEYAEMRSGPLPDAAELARYKDVDERFPDAILQAFQDENDHRRAMELRRHQDVMSERASERTAMLVRISLALVLALAWLAGAVYLGLNGHDWLAAALGISEVCGLGAVFVTGTQAKAKAAATKAIAPRPNSSGR